VIYVKDSFGFQTSIRLQLSRIIQEFGIDP